MEAFDIKITSDDFEGTLTLKEYLKKLLTTLWKEEEGFSGKRPFGNSNWQYDVYKSLIENDLIPGILDEDGSIEDIDIKKADDFIINLINDL